MIDRNYARVLAALFLFACGTAVLPGRAAGPEGEPLGLPADSFPPITAPASLETQARIQLDGPLTVRLGYRAEVTGTLLPQQGQSRQAAGPDTGPIRLAGSVGFEAGERGVSARIVWIRRIPDGMASGPRERWPLLNMVLYSRLRSTDGATVAAGTNLTIVGDIDALRAGVVGFAAATGQRARAGCPDLIHYGRGVVTAQTRTYTIDGKGRPLVADCAPDVTAGLWRIDMDYRGCDWMPAAEEKVFPSYRLVYRPFGDGGPYQQIQDCLPDAQRQGVPFGITIAGCPQIPTFAVQGTVQGAVKAGNAGQGAGEGQNVPPPGTGASIAAQRYGWTTPDGVFRGITPCLDEVPVELRHRAKACSTLPKAKGPEPLPPNLPGVVFLETQVQTDENAPTYRQLLPCLPYGNAVVKQAGTCRDRYFDDPAGMISFPAVAYAVRTESGREGQERLIELEGCLPDPSQVIVHEDRQVGWKNADGVLAAFPIFQATRGPGGPDVGKPRIGDPAQAYTIEGEEVIDAGAVERIACLSFQPKRRIKRYRRPDDTILIVPDLAEPAGIDPAGTFPTCQATPAPAAAARQGGDQQAGPRASAQNPRGARP